MATTVNGFLDTVVTTLDGLTIDGTPTEFSAVRRAPALNLQAIGKAATPLPLAVVMDAGGELHRQSLVLDKRRFRVAVVVSHDRDTLGDFAEQYLLAVHEALLTAFDYDPTNAIYLASDSDSESFTDETGGEVLVVKTWLFTYELRRL